MPALSSLLSEDVTSSTHPILQAESGGTVFAFHFLMANASPRSGSPAADTLQSSPRSPSMGEVLTQTYYNVVAREGVLRGDVSTVYRKYLEIGHPFVVQFNPDHEKNIHCREVVAKLALDEEDTQVVCLADAHASADYDKDVDHGINGMKVAPSGSQLHRLVVNSSPLYAGHSLLLLEAEMQHPQILTPQALLFACRAMTLRGARDDLLMGFNSLGAWASVNHLHLHVMLAGDGMFTSAVAPIQHAPSKLHATLQAANGAVPVKVYKTTTYPLHTYIFSMKESSPQHQVAGQVSSAAARPSGIQERLAWVSDLSCPAAGVSPFKPPSFDMPPSSSTADRMCPPLRAARTPKAVSADLDLAFQHLAACAGQFVKQLQLLDIPHTVLVADGGRTIYVIPRRVQQNLNDGQLNIALAESIGLPIVTTQHAFDSVTSEYLLELYQFFCVSPSTESVLDDWLLEQSESPTSFSITSIQEAIASVLAEKAVSQMSLAEGTPIPGKQIDFPNNCEAKQSDVIEQ